MSFDLFGPFTRDKNMLGGICLSTALLCLVVLFAGRMRNCCRILATCLDVLSTWRRGTCSTHCSVTRSLRTWIRFVVRPEILYLLETRESIALLTR